MTSGRLLSSMLGLSLLIAACDDKVIKGSSTAGSASASASAGVAKGAPLAPKVSTGAVVRTEFAESEFVETERSRDPLRSFAKRFVEESRGRTHSQREVILSQYAVDELKLIGIVTRINPAKAMLVDPTGKGHVVQRGQFVGRPDIVQTAGRVGATYEINWRIDRIRDGDIVLVREDPNNPDVPTATKVIPLRPEGSLVEGKE